MMKCFSLSFLFGTVKSFQFTSVIKSQIFSKWSFTVCAAHYYKRIRTVSVFCQQPDEEVDEWCAALLTLTDKLTESPADRQRLLQVSAANVRYNVKTSIHVIFKMQLYFEILSTSVSAFASKLTSFLNIETGYLEEVRKYFEF